MQKSLYSFRFSYVRFPYEDRAHTWNVDWEFLLGPALLVAPALEPTNGGTTPVSVYIPDDRFYNYHSVRRPFL